MREWHIGGGRSLTIGERTLIMGVVLVYSTMLIAFNLIVDVLYAWADPRIAL